MGDVQAAPRRRLWLAVSFALAATLGNDASFVSGVGEVLRPEMLRQNVAMRCRVEKNPNFFREERYQIKEGWTEIVGHAQHEGMVTIIAPTNGEAKGFKDESVEAEMHTTYGFDARAGPAQKRHTAHVRNGAPATEVFVRVPGQMPWRRVGEISHWNGDWEEAVTGQYELLMRHAYWLYKKVHRWHQSHNKVEFGFADTSMNIVAAKNGPLPLGTRPQQYQDMAYNAGFAKWEGRELRYRGESYQRRMDDKYWSPGGVHRDLNKKWKLDEPLVAKHWWFIRRKWNPDKYIGPYPYMRRHKSKRSNDVLGLAQYR